MVKIIVTHLNPDLDAICAVWLLRKFGQDFENAEVVFVPSGETYKNQKVDADPNIVHVDTGLGEFDHHQFENKNISASSLVLNKLKSKNKDLKNNKALIRLIKVVTETDHFGECLWPQASADRYIFDIIHILNGLKIGGQLDDFGLIEFGSQCLNGIYSSLKLKIDAEEEIQKATLFDTRWGKAIAIETSNNEFVKEAQKQGFILAVQKNPDNNFIRIKARPDSGVDLTPIYDKLVTKDSKATWFLHISKKMLLNGSTKSPKVKPSKLSLKEIIEVLKEG